MSSTPKKGRLSAGERQPYVLRMPPELHRQLKVFAAATGASMNDLLVEAIEAWWSKHPNRGDSSRMVKSAGGE